MLQRHSQTPIRGDTNDRLYAYEHYRAPEHYREKQYNNINNNNNNVKLELNQVPDAGEISKKLFVGGRVNRGITVAHHAEVRNLFARFGGIQARHGPTFVFFTFPTTADAEAALSVDKHNLSDGTSLRVAFAQPDPPPHKVLYLRYLPSDLMASELRAEMAKFGPLDHLDHLPKRNMAFVEFVNLDDAIKAKEYFFDKYTISFYIKHWRENKDKERDRDERDKDIRDREEFEARERAFRGWDMAPEMGRERERDRDRDRELDRIERLERDRIDRDRIERDRLERLDRDREMVERLDRDREMVERMERERMERDRIDRIERDRLERDIIERDMIERDRLERDRIERDRIERDRIEIINRKERERVRMEIERDRYRERDTRERDRRARTESERWWREQEMIRRGKESEDPRRKREHRDSHDKDKKRRKYREPASPPLGDTKEREKERIQQEQEKQKERERDRDRDREKERKRDRKRDSPESSSSSDSDVKSHRSTSSSSSAPSSRSPSPINSRNASPMRNAQAQERNAQTQAQERNAASSPARDEDRVGDGDEPMRSNGGENDDNHYNGETVHDLRRQLMDMGEKVKTILEARNEDKNVISSLKKQIRGYESEVRKLRGEVDQIRKDFEQK